MPKRSDIQSAQEVPPPMRGRSGGGLSEGRMHMPLAREKRTREYSRSMRKNMTDAEKRLGEILRSKAFEGLKFRRQHPIDRYIADFVCLKRRLVIELDGGQHASAQTQDAHRTRYLESQGFRVLRFWNNDVLENIEGVAGVIRDQLQSPPTQPSPAGGEGFSEAFNAQTH